MSFFAYYKYLPCEGAVLFTAVLLPERDGRFPTVIFRSPYVDYAEEMSEDALLERYLGEQSKWLEGGYAVVFQHCRGRGKSSGDCVPYIYEREDGLALHEWVRGERFYNGEIYLVGMSYTASVHYVTAPFAPDIKGAILEAQDSERYNCNYRNGFYKMGLHGGWYVGMYKKKRIRSKNFVTESYNMLPLSSFSETVFGERAEDFDAILRHPEREDPFWHTRFGGGEAHGALMDADIPILLVTGFYDIYTGGIFDIWNSLDARTRAKSALVVHPYDHGGSPESQPVRFENGTLGERFGEWKRKWIDHVRLGTEAPVERNKVTYYRLFDGWHTDCFEEGKGQVKFILGDGERTYRYNPYSPASFKGGLSTNFGGTAYQDKPDSRYDILSFYTEKFDTDTHVRGKMSAKLRVRSTAPDTCFYMRVSLATDEGDLGLRDDINRISSFCGDYVPEETVDMTFSFDEHSFVIKAGQRLRVDISSSAFPLYVRHTNRKGLFSEIDGADVADNTVVLSESFICVPIIGEAR